VFNSLIFCFWKKPSASRPVRVPVPETKIKNGLWELPDEEGSGCLAIQRFYDIKSEKTEISDIPGIHHLHYSSST